MNKLLVNLTAEKQFIIEVPDDVDTSAVVDELADLADTGEFELLRDDVDYLGDDYPVTVNYRCSSGKPA
jgi:hypothetical protein